MLSAKHLPSFITIGAAYIKVYTSAAPSSAELPSSWEFVFTFFYSIVLSLYFLCTELSAAVLQHESLLFSLFETYR